MTCNNMWQRAGRLSSVAHESDSECSSLVSIHKIKTTEAELVFIEAFRKNTSDRH